MPGVERALGDGGPDASRADDQDEHAEHCRDICTDAG
jgi:hypothetical protein